MSRDCDTMHNEEGVPLSGKVCASGQSGTILEFTHFSQSLAGIFSEVLFSK
jgi:hypothetical protein